MNIENKDVFNMYVMAIIDMCEEKKRVCVCVYVCR